MTTATTLKRRTAAQLAADGFAALVEKLGMAEAVRYVQLFEPGAGDYARDRDEWLNPLSSEQIAKQIAQVPEPSPGKKPRRRNQKPDRRAAD